MRALVTGASGFVGVHLTRLLRERGHDVRCLVRPSSRRANLDGLGVAFHVGDLGDRRVLRQAIDGCDVVFHCAADYRFQARAADEIYRNNVTGTENLFAAAVDVGVGRVVYTSSVATLGLSSDGTAASESAPSTLGSMIGAYKRSKFLAERVADSFVAMHKLPIVIVNPSTPVGEDDARPTPTGQFLVDFLSGRIPGLRRHRPQRRRRARRRRGAPAGRRARRRRASATSSGTATSPSPSCSISLARISGVRWARVRLPHVVPLLAALLEAPLARLRRRPAAPVAGRGAHRAQEDVLRSRQGGARAGPAPEPDRDRARARGRVVSRAGVRDVVTRGTTKTTAAEATDPSSMTAIVAAMPEEVRPLWRRLTRQAACRVGRARVLHGRLGRHVVVVAATGEGDKRARAATAELLRVFPARRIIVIGAAGALSLGLRAGALVIADDVRRPGAEPLRPDASLVEWAARTSGARLAHVITTSAIASSVTVKAALDERHGDGRAAVVDLESAGYAEAADDAGVPWLVLRAVADTADESLPEWLDHCRDATGAIRRARVAWALLGDPRTVPRLLELRRRIAAGGLAMARAVLSLLDAWPTGIDIRPRGRTRALEEL